MLRYYKESKTACIEIRIGDKVKYKDGSIGTLEKIELMPNGVHNPGLIARLTIKCPDKKIMATANHFLPVDGEQYLDN